MALVNEEWCERCQKNVFYTNGKCNICADKKNKERIRMWEAQDIETKITNLRERIEGLERGEARY